MTSPVSNREHQPLSCTFGLKHRRTELRTYVYRGCSAKRKSSYSRTHVLIISTCAENVRIRRRCGRAMPWKTAVLSTIYARVDSAAGSAWPCAGSSKRLIAGSVWPGFCRSRPAKELQRPWSRHLRRGTSWPHFEVEKTAQRGSTFSYNRGRSCCVSAQGRASRQPNIESDSRLGTGLSDKGQCLHCRGSLYQLGLARNGKAWTLKLHVQVEVLGEQVEFGLVCHEVPGHFLSGVGGHPTQYCS